jgi:hypothetical protein
MPTSATLKTGKSNQPAWAWTKSVTYPRRQRSIPLPIAPPMMAPSATTGQPAEARLREPHGERHRHRSDTRPSSCTPSIVTKPRSRRGRAAGRTRRRCCGCGSGAGSRTQLATRGAERHLGHDPRLAELIERRRGGREGEGGPAVRHRREVYRGRAAGTRPGDPRYARTQPRMPGATVDTAARRRSLPVKGRPWQPPSPRSRPASAVTTARGERLVPFTEQLFRRADEAFLEAFDSDTLSRWRATASPSSTALGAAPTRPSGRGAQPDLRRRRAGSRRTRWCGWRSATGPSSSTRCAPSCAARASPCPRAAPDLRGRARRRRPRRAVVTAGAPARRGVDGRGLRDVVRRPRGRPRAPRAPARRPSSRCCATWCWRPTTTGRWCRRRARSPPTCATLRARTAQGRFRERAEELEEYAAFLAWLEDGHFVFLGYRGYDRRPTRGASAPSSSSPARGSGCCARSSAAPTGRRCPCRSCPEGLRERVLEGPTLIVTKANAESTVHRPARIDYIGVKKLGDGFQVMGEHRFLGLLTTKAYGVPAEEVPLLRMKLRQVLELDGAPPGSHDYKQIVAIFNALPRADLFWADAAGVQREIRTIMGLEQERGVRLLVRPTRSAAGSPSWSACRATASTARCGSGCSSTWRRRSRRATSTTSWRWARTRRRSGCTSSWPPTGASPTSTSRPRARGRDLTRRWDDHLRTSWCRPWASARAGARPSATRRLRRPLQGRHQRGRRLRDIEHLERWPTAASTSTWCSRSTTPAARR